MSVLMTNLKGTTGLWPQVISAVSVQSGSGRLKLNKLKLTPRPYPWWNVRNDRGPGYGRVALFPTGRHGSKAATRINYE